MVEGVIKAGVNVVRLNFSHGTHDEQKVRADIARDVAKKLNLPISILFDTKGPEIRVCPLKDGAIVINQGDSVTIECLKKIEGTNSSFSVTDASGKYNMAKDCKVGNVVCVDDGKLRLTIKRVDVKAGKVFTTAVNSHKVTTNKRINLPGANYSMPFLSEKDINDTKFACQQGYEYLAASFANSAEDINSIKNICNSCGTNGKNIKILAKNETLTACNNLQSIIDSCDGCMVARGDLGIEIPFYDVPY
jgi:pyruvate kinase